MSSLLKAIGYAKNIWPYYLGIVFSALLVAATSVAVPFIIKAATDLMVTIVQGGAADVSGALVLAALLICFDAANVFIRNWGGYLGDVMAAKIKAQLSTRYFEHLLRLPLGYYDDELTGTIINRLNRAINEISNFLNMFANTFLQMIITMIITVIIVGWYSLELALLVFVLYPLFLWLTALTSKRWQAYQSAKNLETDIASGRFAEVVTQMKVVKSYVKEKLEHRHFRVRFHRTIAMTREQSAYWHNRDILRGLVLGLIFFAIYAYIFAQTAHQRFTIGEMVLLIALINLVRQPIFTMSFIVDSFQRAMTGSKDYVKAMELRPEAADHPGARKLEVAHGKVVFSAVEFGYNRTHHVLKGVSFTVEAGQKVALIGESGEGKTTITNLLMRFYEPSAGAITIDDADISTATQESLRRNIATVFQDPALFSGTIRENIAYAYPRASDKQVIEAAKAANAHEFIMLLNKGYDTEIGERGIRLSGGQKQRIAIARAILKDSPILILDEATSSLDNRSEHLVQEALERLMQNRTTLIIAHRLSTIAHVDKIVTIHDGKVGEQGTPAALAKTDGIYAQLLALQEGVTPRAKRRLGDYEIVSD